MTARAMVRQRCLMGRPSRLSGLQKAGIAVLGGTLTVLALNGCAVRGLQLKVEEGTVNRPLSSVSTNVLPEASKL